MQKGVKHLTELLAKYVKNDDFRFFALWDALSADLPSKLECFIRHEKRKNINDLPDEFVYVQKSKGLLVIAYGRTSNFVRKRT